MTAMAIPLSPRKQCDPRHASPEAINVANSPGVLSRPDGGGIWTLGGAGANSSEIAGNLSRHSRRRRTCFDSSGEAESVKGWDSEAHLRLMIATEAAFAVRFEAKEIDSLSNVGALADLIRRKVG
jgi:acyl carrier protein